MPVLKRAVPVSCDLEFAFDYVSDLRNLGAFMPMFTETHVEDHGSDRPGSVVDVTMALGNSEARTRLEVAEVTNHRRFAIKSSDRLALRISWEFDQLWNRVHISFAFEYQLPAEIAHSDEERRTIEKDLKDMATKSTDQLKWLLETKVAGRKA